MFIYHICSPSDFRCLRYHQETVARFRHLTPLLHNRLPASIRLFILLVYAAQAMTIVDDPTLDDKAWRQGCSRYVEYILWWGVTVDVVIDSSFRLVQTLYPQPNHGGKARSYSRVGLEYWRLGSTVRAYLPWRCDDAEIYSWKMSVSATSARNLHSCR